LLENKLNKKNDDLIGTFSSIAESVQQILMRYNLCNSCLGRQFALLGWALTNYQRGECIKLYMTLSASEIYEAGRKEEATILLKLIAEGGFQPAITTLNHLGMSTDSTRVCYICEGIMERLDLYRDLIQVRLADLEYNTYLVGTRVPENIIDREDALRAEFGLKYGESIKAELNREIGKKLQIPDKIVDFDSPDIVVVINPVTQEIELQINPLFIYGRYRKLKRGISQTRWICWNCEGHGCEECNGTGLRYELSVEVFIAEPILKAAQGTDYKFHGSGREDIDARMLGGGRPFVVEVKEPKQRGIDLNLLQKQINEAAQGNIEVLDLVWSDRGTIRNIKALSQVTEKIYRMLVETETPVSSDVIKQADETLTGAVIQQQTPRRVLHRRADKLRFKQVYDFKTNQLEPNKLEITVRCQGGCYVKELISGDEGRTQPNLSDLLKTPATVLELDVIHVA
jgi:tRNA pseudouridine synthase 10